MEIYVLCYLVQDLEYIVIYSEYIYSTFRHSGGTSVLWRHISTLEAHQYSGGIITHCTLC